MGNSAASRIHLARQYSTTGKYDAKSRGLRRRENGAEGFGRINSRSPFVQAQSRVHSLKEAAREASRHAERELILKVLSRTRWNRKRAAEELRISYKALLYKLKQIGLEEEPSS